jgi:S1-C subfamily serine protease
MVLTSNGEVLTNNHVIEGATTISVTDIGNGKTYSATVVGYDRTEDVAVIQLKNASGLKTVTIGSSSGTAKGEGVVGIGNAGGVGGTPSVAGGSVTATGQSITASDSGDGTSEKLTNLIQTNCNIQPGDSGGPLVNTSGKVIGMDTAASGSSGGGFSFRTQTGQTASSQGFSIPINEAITLAKKFEAGDASTTVHIGKTAFIGVEVSSTSSTSSPGGSGAFNFTSGATTATPGTTTTKGAHIAGVVPNEPADQAGLAKGDVITGVDGKTVTSATTLTSLLELYHPGNTVKLTWVTASGQKQTATVTLGTGPSA